MLALGAVAFILGKNVNYRAMGAGNFPRLLNRLAFVFKPEGAAMTNSKLKAILFEEIFKARNLPAQAISRPFK